MLRALLDANVLISALLSLQHPMSAVTRIVRAALGGAYTLLLPVDVLDETLDAVITTPYLAARITVGGIQWFDVTLRFAAEQLPSLSAPPPAMTRAPTDDYLLAHALAARADYLVSGDKDVLALANEGFPFKIVSPSEFLAVLEEEGRA